MCLAYRPYLYDRQFTACRLNFVQQVFVNLVITSLSIIDPEYCERNDNYQQTWPVPCLDTMLFLVKQGGVTLSIGYTP